MEENLEAKEPIEVIKDRRMNDSKKEETKLVMYNPQEVKIIDMKMPFLSMVFFMLKWALASIPAFIIFFTIMGLLGALIAPWYHPVVVTY